MELESIEASFDHPKRIKIKHEEETPDHESQRAKANPSNQFDHQDSSASESM
jgi:hypothetical protein